PALWVLPASSASVITRQDYAENRTMRPVWEDENPPGVSLDNRAANCQTHAHVVRLCREECVEHTINIFRAYASSSVFNGYSKAHGVVRGGSNRQYPSAVKKVAHSTNAIGTDFHHAFLQLTLMAGINGICGASARVNSIFSASNSLRTIPIVS